ncbi:hypothetical protein HYC85_017654 [Camellia sinensis]|uniref:Uncharacterized protein n=1 Tax=Camellia sinensis TaxID=4442 RepID=A0A7J7GSZ6_CAMSI|nr:hypothetical protein HYC85_017654 [Camellia sinensis]
MEGVGARFGRSSTRYGPSSTVTVAFNGPVRKWKKKWVPESPSPNTNNIPSSSNHHNDDSTVTNGNNGSHRLLLYKWTPISRTKTTANDDVTAAAALAAAEEPPRRKFKYIPIAVLENEAAEKVDVEAHAAEAISKNDGLDDKPDINDLPMDESQARGNIPLARQDLNESTLDLSLGFKDHDGHPDFDVKADRSKDGQLEKLWNCQAGQSWNISCNGTTGFLS